MTLKPWLSLSLCLNLLLAGALVWGTKSRRQFAGSAPVSRPITNCLARRTPAAGAASNTVVEVRPPFCWQQIESNDYRVYVKNLRTIGCPEATLRDIIVADVNELFTGRVRDLVNPVQDRFWSLMLHEDEMKKLVEDKEKELKAFDEEQQEILSALLGQKNLVSDMRKEENWADRQANWKQTLDFLSVDKAAQVLDLKERFEQARRDLQESSDGRDPKLKEN